MAEIEIIDAKCLANIVPIGSPACNICCMLESWQKSLKNRNIFRVSWWEVSVIDDEPEAIESLAVDFSRHLILGICVKSIL